MKRRNKNVYFQYILQQFKFLIGNNLTYVGREKVIIKEKYIFKSENGTSTSIYGYILNLQSSDSNYTGLYRVDSETYYKVRKGKAFKEMSIIKSEGKGVIAFSNKEDEISAKREVRKEAIKIALQLIIFSLLGILLLIWLIFFILLKLVLF